MEKSRFEDSNFESEKLMTLITLELFSKRKIQTISSKKSHFSEFQTYLTNNQQRNKKPVQILLQKSYKTNYVKSTQNFINQSFHSKLDQKAQNQQSKQIVKNLLKKCQRYYRPINCSLSSYREPDSSRLKTQKSQKSQTSLEFNRLVRERQHKEQLKKTRILKVLSKQKSLRLNKLLNLRGKQRKLKQVEFLQKF